jgi:membrane protein DedA with SNARE-associated domain
MTEWLTSVIGSLGYVGIFLLLILARSVPPVPAETAIPLAGLAAVNGELSLPLIALAGGLGSAVGELVWYLPSRLLGRERLMRFLHRHGHWLTLRPEEVDRASAWFARHGGLAVVVCQPFPGLRTMISVPAGALGLPLPLFLLYAALGSTAFVLALASAGYFLGSGWPAVAQYLGWFSLALFGLVLLVYLVRLGRQLRRRHRAG